MDDVDEFDAAMAAAMDPQRDTPGVTIVERVVQATSWWHPHRCTTCGHTFRRGDRVRFDTGSGQVWHLEEELGCHREAGTGTAERRLGEADLAELARFLDGIDANWRVAGGVPVVPADTDPQLVAPPIGGLARKECLGCAHSFRPGELVVICPCSPVQPECHYAVHRDPGLGLVCWETWRPSGMVAVCPVTLRRLAGGQ
ncbi:hypothetical protein ACIBSW_13435 [Actinoplanes sp. NPDC049668]|uniref:hypothetical protein n=1 Tax=unclassified Actinoplanes TaxID=2626549 RepID=UPI0033AA2165